MKLTGTLTTERFDTSRNGNPRYICHIDGIFFYTGVDSSHGYGITNHENKVVTVELGYKRNKLTLLNLESE